MRTPTATASTTLQAYSPRKLFSSRYSARKASTSVLVSARLPWRIGNTQLDVASAAVMKFWMESMDDLILLSSLALSTPLASAVVGMGMRASPGAVAVVRMLLGAPDAEAAAVAGAASERALLSTTFCNLETLRN